MILTMCFGSGVDGNVDGVTLMIMLMMLMSFLMMMSLANWNRKL